MKKSAEHPADVWSDIWMQKKQSLKTKCLSTWMHFVWNWGCSDMQYSAVNESTHAPIHGPYMSIRRMFLSDVLQQLKPSKDGVFLTDFACWSAQVQQEPLHHQLSGSQQALTGNPWPWWQCWNLEISPGSSRNQLARGRRYHGTIRNDSISTDQLRTIR